MRNQKEIWAFVKPQWSQIIESVDSDLSDSEESKD